MLRKVIIFLISTILFTGLCTTLSVNAENEKKAEITGKPESSITDNEKTNNEAANNKNEEYLISGSELSVDCEAAILMEGSTGKIIYAKNATKELCPASITKIMTLLLIFEALDRGEIALTDSVTVSEQASGMGGSQVFLEPGETQTVDTMIKCITVSSANDAAVAMAEYIAGTEEEFVNRMNIRAKELGMKNTHFENCCGLDTDNHYSSAKDVAIMSRELIVNHPEISDYSTIWMDTITHVTKRGSSEFGLSNTNKLVRYYEGITGLKTGSTSIAKYCLSATAKRDGMDLIAVIMAAPDTKRRFSEAQKLLDYGFANLSVYKNYFSPEEPLTIKVKGGALEKTGLSVRDEFSYVFTKEKSMDNIHHLVNIPSDIKAPVNKDTKIGSVDYYYNDNLLGSVPLYADEDVKKAGVSDYLKKLLAGYFK